MTMPVKCPACLGAIDLADDALFLAGCPHCHMMLPRGRDQWEKLAYAGENARLRVFLSEEVLPRYREMFEAAGLGVWADSVVYQRAIELLGE